MDALSLLSGRAAVHPVTRPDFAVSYEQKDITADIRPYLLALVYTDYLGGQSDELQIDLEDTDGRWLNGWYPEQGDRLSVRLGDQFTGMVDWGSFEIAEIEYRCPPNTISIKALSTGITKANRTLRPRAYEHTTLAKIVRTVAARLKLSVTGTVADIAIERVTQYQERDVEFLTRLARQYGHTFKIVGERLVFAANAELAKTEPVAVLLPEDIVQFRFRDLIRNVPEKVVVSGYDTKAKKPRSVSRKSRPLRKGAKKAATGDTLRIVANRGESEQQLAARADAALAEAQQSQIAGSVTLFGNALLVAGQVVCLRNIGKLSGKYLVQQARHELRRSAGYTTELDIKMIEYDEEEKNNAASHA